MDGQQSEKTNRTYVQQNLDQTRPFNFGFIDVTVARVVTVARIKIISLSARDSAHAYHLQESLYDINFARRAAKPLNLVHVFISRCAAIL